MSCSLSKAAATYHYSTNIFRQPTETINQFEELLGHYKDCEVKTPCKRAAKAITILARKSFSDEAAASFRDDPRKIEGYFNWVKTTAFPLIQINGKELYPAEILTGRAIAEAHALHYTLAEKKLRKSLHKDSESSSEPTLEQTTTPTLYAGQDQIVIATVNAARELSENISLPVPSARTMTEAADATSFHHVRQESEFNCCAFPTGSCCDSLPDCPDCEGGDGGGDCGD